MGTRLHLVLVALFAFIGAIACDPVATTRLPKSPAFSAIREIHERIRAANDVEKREIDSRQTSQCQFPPGYPRECNTSLIEVTSISTAVYNSQSVTPMQLEIYNNALTQFCAPRCVDPYVTYFECQSSNVPSVQEYFRQRIRQGICGKKGNDFCEIVYFHDYSDNPQFLNRLVNVDCAPRITTGSILTVNCSTSDVCAKNVADFIATMGCCTIPYLGAVTPSCGVTPDPPCQSVVSGSGPAIYLAIFPMLLAILSVGFLL